LISVDKFETPVLNADDPLKLGIFGINLRGGVTLADVEGLPLLVVVANNRSFFNDEVHQERVARRRGRPVENRWIGQHIRDPDPDLATLARSLGLRGHGPVETGEELERALASAVDEAAGGAAVLVDVRVRSSVPA
jgi:thiamine pyrophosphate-dependent acetolactate synthase large subunit-like protein